MKARQVSWSIALGGKTTDTEKIMRLRPGIYLDEAQKLESQSSEKHRALALLEFVAAQAIWRQPAAINQETSQGLFANFQVAEGIQAIDP